MSRRRKLPFPHDVRIPVDPEHPSDQLDDTGEFQVENEAEAAPALEEVTAEEPSADDRDVGELYGVHTPYAGDTDLSAPEDRDAFEGSWRGETWLESLEQHAADMGPAPEEEIVLLDDSDVEHPGHRGHHPTDWRDRPVADKGSGGPAGR